MLRGLSVHILVIFYLFLLAPCVHAQEQEEETMFSKLKSRLSLVDNPFKPLLPKKEEPKVEDPVIPKGPEDPNDGRGGPTRIDPIGPTEPEISIPGLPQITIEGIIWNSDRPQAIVNGKVLDIGGTILQIHIKEIQKDQIKGLFYGKPVLLNSKGVQYE